MIEPETFLDLEVPTDIKISPSGKQIVYSTNLAFGAKKAKAGNAVSTIWLAGTGKEKSTRQLTSGQFNDTSPQWSVDGGSIAFTSDRAKAGKSSAIYVLSLEGGEPYPVTKADNEKDIAGFRWSPDGKSIAFISPDEKTAERKARDEERDDVMVYGEDWQYNRLRLLHVSTKTVTTLVRKDAHVASFAWSEDSKSLVYSTWKTPDLNAPGYHGVEIEEVSVVDKSVKSVCHFDGMIMNSFEVLDGKLYFVAGVTPRSCATGGAVYQLSLSSGDYSVCAYGQQDTASALYKSGKTLIVKVLHGLTDSLRLLDGKVLYMKQTELHSTDVHGLDGSTGECIMAVAEGSTNDPLEVYSVIGKDCTQLSDHGHAFASVTLGTDVPLSCESTDGAVQLDGFFVAPSCVTMEQGKPEKPMPTVVLIHGGPYYHATLGFDTLFFYWTPMLLDAGYAILCPNYRGNRARGEDFAAAARGGMGTTDYADVIAVVDHGIKEGLVDKERMIVGGWSQGGFLSYLCAVRNGQHGFGWTFKGAITGAGVTDWDMLSCTSDLPRFESELAGAAPWQSDKSVTKQRQGSAVWEMKEAVEKKAIPPILILHGEKDQRTPLTQAWAFHRGCLEYGIPCEMAVYPREGHPIQERSHLVDMLKRIKRFCDTHLS
ncbi:hypothetical protein LTR66_008492 [Elasticomyces elasticus]|nr:hypothetical protein LTR66_008492 [Elasticomyces elasticus]